MKFPSSENNFIKIPHPQRKLHRTNNFCYLTRHRHYKNTTPSKSLPHFKKNITPTYTNIFPLVTDSDATYKGKIFNQGG